MILIEPLRNRGRKIGKVTVNTSFNPQMLLRQKTTGTLIDGVYCNTSSIIDNLWPSDNSDINNLVIYLKQLNKLYLDFEKVPRWDRNLELFEAELLPCYKNLEDICIKVHNRIHNSFRYKNQTNLEEGQKLFLALLEELIKRYRRIEPFENRHFYKILILCLDRGELRYDYLTQERKQKQNIIVQYEKNFRTLFIKALEDLETSTNSEARNFSICLLARAYFRSKIFRTELLLRLPQAEIDQPALNKTGSYSLFGWDFLFSDLNISENYGEQSEELVHKIKTAASKILKDVIFIPFLAEMIKTIQRDRGLMKAEWNSIKGFSQIIKHFILRFLINLPADLPPVLNITISLVTDPYLFLKFSNVIQDHYEGSSTRRIEFTFSLFNKWCAKLREEKISLPLRFRSYWITAQLEHHSVEDRVYPLFEIINFIYLNFDMFSVHVKMSFVRRMINNHFELIVHWNALIRKIVALLFSFRFLYYFEHNRVECDTEVVLMLKKIIFLQQTGKCYNEALSLWDKKTKIEKKKSPLTMLENDVIAQISSSRIIVESSLFKEILTVNDFEHNAMILPKLLPQNLIYCQKAYSYFLSSYEAYLRSEYRSSGDEKELFNFIYAGGYDKSEFRENI